MNNSIRLRAPRLLTFRHALVTGVFLACTGVGRAADVEIIAHRGGYRLYPENTCAGFSVRAGQADIVEFDVRVCADGELVVMHDATVTRTTGGIGAITNESGVVLTNVADLTLAQLKTLDVGALFSPAFVGERIPTFAEALRAMPSGCRAMVHCKSGTPQAIRAVLRAENAVSNAIIYSDDWNFLYAFRQLEPGATLCAGGSGKVLMPNLAALNQKGIYMTAWAVDTLTQDEVNMIHSRHMTIYVSATCLDMQKFIDMGVDGIMSDTPRLATSIAKSIPSPNRQLSEGLVAYWKLDDGLDSPAASILEDVEEQSRGLIRGFIFQPAWLAGDAARMGGALAFDGVDDWVQMPTNEFLDIGANAVTLSLWVKLNHLPSAATNGYACIYDSEFDAYSIYMDQASGELRFKATDSTLQGARPGIPEAQLRTGVWHHVAGVYDGAASPAAGQTLIYLDGRLQDVHVGGDTSPRYGMTGPVRKGQQATLGRNGPNSAFFFSGAVDDIAVWQRALSPAEIRQIYEAGTNGIPLAKQVLTIWIDNVYPDLETGDMQMDLRVEHGSLTNQPLNLRAAVVSTGSYAQQAVLEGAHGRRPCFRVPQANIQHLAGRRDAGRPNYFQIVCP